MNTMLSTDPRVHEFAEAVRAQLRDLSPEEVEDLTDGLEADLDEHARENNDFEFGDPVSYANELRESAGLPARTDARRHIFAGMRSDLQNTSQIIGARIRRSPGASRALDFVISLRPVWWVLRAVVGFVVLLPLLGSFSDPLGALFQIVLFLGILIVSVQWGRGLWLPRTWLYVVMVTANVIALVGLAAMLLIGAAQLSAAQMYGSAQAEPAPEGLTRNGNAITNIFAYDANGEPLTGVQLFDQGGKPLSAKLPYQDYLSTNGETALVPNRGATNGNGWNVFPFDSIPLSSINPNTDQPYSSAVPSAVTLPFAQVQPLAKPAPVRDGSGVTSAWPTPTPSESAPAEPTAPAPSNPAAP